MGVLSYENMLTETLEHNKLLLVLKPTSSGITEYFLRWILWKILATNEWKDALVCIIVGPAESLATRLVMRLKRIIQEKHDIAFHYARNVLFLNDCEIITVPSHNMSKLRSLVNPKCLFISEAEYMPELADVRQNTERFIAKSNPYIIYESTIRSATGLYAEILKEEPSIYKKITIDWQTAMDEGMYDPEMIEKAKRSRSWAKEFLCDVFSLGNITGTFPATWVRRAFKNNEELNCTEYALGIDSGWFPAYTGIFCVGKNSQGMYQVQVAEEYNESEDSIIELVMLLRERFHAKNIYIDSSDKRLVRKLSLLVGERDYDEHLAFLKRYKILSPYNKLRDLRIVVPILFSQNSSRQMTSYLRNCLEQDILKIPNVCTSLQKALYSCQDIDGDIIKEKLQHGHGSDILDAAGFAFLG
jgi:hypothetical protein